MVEYFLSSSFFRVISEKKDHKPPGTGGGGVLRSSPSPYRDILLEIFNNRDFLKLKCTSVSLPTRKIINSCLLCIPSSPSFSLLASCLLPQTVSRYHLPHHRPILRGRQALPALEPSTPCKTWYVKPDVKQGKCYWVDLAVFVSKIFRHEINLNQLLQYSIRTCEVFAKKNNF